MTSLSNTLSRFFYNKSLGLLLIRVAMGLLFLTHGWMKVSSMPGVVMMMMHFGFPGWVAYFIAWLEVVGGLALILGIATRLFAAIFGIEMLVATFLVGFGGGLGLDFVLAVVAFGIAFTGSGRYSVYKMECNHCGGIFCDSTTGTCVVVS
jgi:putative oxidoreductase